jgi:hypothetical protein
LIGNKYATYNIIQDHQTKMRHNKHEVLRPESVGLDILYCSQNFKWLGFPIFRFERTWWRLLQKRVVPTIKFDIFVFIIQTYKWIRHNELLQKFPHTIWFHISRSYDFRTISKCPNSLSFWKFRFFFSYSKTQNFVPYSTQSKSWLRFLRVQPTGGNFCNSSLCLIHL